MKLTFVLTLVLTVEFTAALANAQTVPIGPEAQRRAEALLKQMTVDEKIGQLTQAAGILLAGLSTEKPDRLIAQGKAGSVLWLTDVKEINRLQHIAMDQSRLHIPLIVGFDVIHGYRTAFPVPLGMASSWDPSVEEQAQRVAAEDSRAAGIQWTFAPMVDIARDARWGRIVEGAGEDPYLGSAMARAQVRGFQGSTIGANSVLACVKHFAGYGAAEGGRDYDSSYIPEELLRNVFLRPFEAAAHQGAGSFMSAYMDLNDVPATGNRWLLTDILRKEWGFNGFVVSDALAVKNLITHGYASDPADAAYKAMHAGLNMDMASLTYANNLRQVMDENRATEAQLDAAVLPILALKYQLGLFEHPYVDESRVEAILTRPEGLALERKLAARSMVLLKNESHTLPLKTSLKKVLVIGFLADSAHDIEGGWTVEGLFGTGSKSHPVTVLAGIRNKLGKGAQVTYISGPMMQREYPSMFDVFQGRKPQAPPTQAEISDVLARVKSASAQADMVVAVLGELSDMSSEMASRASLSLPGIQEEMLEAASRASKPVVLVLENGRPLDIRWAAAHVPSILECWYPGTEGGNAVADVLFGDVNPGGKLPVSWPRAAGQEPLYPFGYGLSYTTFKFANLRLTKTSIQTGEATEISVDVSNTGAAAGDAVAQIYIHQRFGSASRPVRELEGFERVALQPGENKKLKFRLGRQELEFWSPQTKQWSMEPATFDVWAGEDSTASLHAELTVTP